MQHHTRRPRILARLGGLGLAFFVVKGLAWLIVPAAIAYCGH
jgi:hypothetical protein